MAAVKYKPILTLLLSLSCASGASPTDAPAPTSPAPTVRPPPRAEAPAPEPDPPESTDAEDATPWANILWWNAPDPYMLDHIPRRAERDERGRLQCPDLDIVGYRGDAVRYHRAVRVNDSFRERLRRFEEIVARVGEEVYGRPPSHIEHMGTQNCRVIRHRRYRLSEHALANAIDIAGFRFPALPRDERDRAPEGLGRGFRVDIEDHWDGVRGRDRHHAIFLKKLVEEIWYDRVFRGVIVPPARGHKNHLHLDMGRWRFFRGDTTMPPDPDLEPAES